MQLAPAAVENPRPSRAVSVRVFGIALLPGCMGWSAVLRIRMNAHGRIDDRGGDGCQAMVRPAMGRWPVPTMTRPDRTWSLRRDEPGVRARPSPRIVSPSASATTSAAGSVGTSYASGVSHGHRIIQLAGPGMKRESCHLRHRAVRHPPRLSPPLPCARHDEDRAGQGQYAVPARPKAAGPTRRPSHPLRPRRQPARPASCER